LEWLRFFAALRMTRGAYGSRRRAPAQKKTSRSRFRERDVFLLFRFV
jgi:uncharacterized protein YueI